MSTNQPIHSLGFGKFGNANRAIELPFAIRVGVGSQLIEDLLHLLTMSSFVDVVHYSHSDREEAKDSQVNIVLEVEVEITEETKGDELQVIN